MVALREKLKVPVTLDTKGLSLREAVKKVAAAAGLRVSLESDGQDQSEKPVSLTTLKDMPAGKALNFLARDVDARLHYRFTETGVVFTLEGAESPWARAEEIGNWIEDLRSRRFPTAEEKAQRKEAADSSEEDNKVRKEAIEMLKKALRATTVNRDFADASFEEVLQWLAKESKVMLYLSSSAEAKVRSEAKKLTIKGGSRSAEKVLDQLLGPYGFKYGLREDGLGITTQEDMDAQHERTLLFTSEYQQAERKFFSQKLTIDLKGSRVCDLVKGLSKELGVEVYADSRAWGTEVSLPRNTAGVTFRKVAEAFKRHGVEVEIAVSRSFYRPQPWFPDRPAPTKPLPGAPPAEWTIVLLKPKK